MKLKNIFYALSLVFALGTFTACDDDENNIPLIANPGEAAAGTYAGTWTQTDDDGTVQTATGTVTVTAGSDIYYANIALACDDASWNMTGDGWSSVTNISQADEGFVIVNMSTTNGLGCVFSGRIEPVDGGDQLTLDFTKSIRQGRLTYTYVYKFVGTKSN